MVSTLALLCLSGCDLRHADQRRFCASAAADPTLCASRPDWCIATGGAECVEAVEGANCSECAPGSTENTACRAPQSLLEDCPGKAVRLKDGAFTPLGEWDWENLDRTRLEPMIGRTLAQADVEGLSEHDRHVVCGPGTGGDWTGLLPCRLEWSEPVGRATCMVDEAMCATMCSTHLRDVQCIAKNLCSDTICF